VPETVSTQDFTYPKYYETLRNLPNLKAKAEWFESRGYTYTKEES